MTAAMLELSLVMGNAYNRELSAWEKTRQAQKLKEALLKAKKEDGLEIPGKLRDVIAGLMHESSSNIAKMASISKNASKEIKEEFKKGNLGITGAYEAAKLPPDKQKTVASEIAEGRKMPVKKIAEKAKVFETNTSQNRPVKEMTGKGKGEAIHAKILQEWSRKKEDIPEVRQSVSKAMKKVFETNTARKNWKDIDWTVFLAKGIMHYADCVSEEDLYLLHDIMVRCREKAEK